jgi:signal transduction histidine kinase
MSSSWRAREAVLNAVSHAEASELSVSLDTRSNELIISIIDNGKGFDPAFHECDGRHFGISSMKERMDKVGGILQINSSIGSGSRVELHLHLTSEMIRASNEGGRQ